MRNSAVLLRRLVAVGALTLLSACAFTPHDLHLQPAAPSASTVGQNTAVFFRFVDERDDVTVGHRGVGGNGAKISAESLSKLVETQLRQSLQQKKYRLVDSEPGATASVVYRLRSFKFDIERGFFSGGRNSTAALAVDARRSDKTYANVYRYNNEERIMVVPGGDEIDGQMNAALNQILVQAYTDDSLDRLLTGQ
jgi:uncharacterized lipoprotein YajG